MAKRTAKVQRATAVPEHPDTIALSLSSGYSVLVEPMPYAIYQKLKERQQKRFPEPSLPMVEIALEDGSSTSVVAGNDSPEAIQYMIDIAEVARQRTEFTLDFMLDHYLVGLVDATEADVLADKHVKKNLEMMRLLDDDVPDDDDPELWGYVFRHCVLASRADYELVRNSILLLTSPVSQEEIAEAGASFWRDLPGQKRPNA